LSDEELAVLLLNPIALDGLAFRIDEDLPDYWLERMSEIGRRGMQAEGVVRKPRKGVVAMPEEKAEPALRNGAESMRDEAAGRSEDRPTGKRYRLLAPDGSTYESEQPGLLGGNKRKRIYGCLDCSRAKAALPGYARNRVFFADEAAAIAAGYRPCGHCL